MGQAILDSLWRHDIRGEEDETGEDMESEEGQEAEGEGCTCLGPAECIGARRIFIHHKSLPDASPAMASRNFMFSVCWAVFSPLWACFSYNSQDSCQNA